MTSRSEMQQRTSMKVRARPGEAAAWVERHLVNPPDTDECVLYPYAVAAGAMYKKGSLPRLILGLRPGDGLVARHSCHNPACVNRRHLSVGTPADNSQDMIDAGRSLTGARNPNFGLVCATGKNPQRTNPAIQITRTS